MSEEEFSARLEALKRGQERIQKIRRSLLREGEDFGVIPGTQKPTLYKSGAEKLCDFYRLRADFSPQEIVGDGDTTPTIRYIVTCRLHLSEFGGPIVACGLGMASSWEKKYRYRRGAACPTCGNTETMRRDKNTQGWYCWQKIGGCGATFSQNEIVQGDLENPDQWDLAVTLLKMAEKRAFIDATLRATAASGLFTQDMEDSSHVSPGSTPPAVSPTPKAPQERKVSSPSPAPPAPPAAQATLTGGIKPAQWTLIQRLCEQAGQTPPNPSMTEQEANALIRDLRSPK
jgi:hypothetical protein